jgi:hypothetical protein
MRSKCRAGGFFLAPFAVTGASFKNGGAAAAELDYVPLPPSVVTLVQGAWRAQLKDAAGKGIY